MREEWRSGVPAKFCTFSTPAGPTLLRLLKQSHTPTVPIPTFDKMLDPLLAIAAKEPLTRRTATTAMQQQFNLTEEERNARIPSGQSTVVGNRAGWAMTFLTKAGLSCGGEKAKNNNAARRNVAVGQGAGRVA